MYTLIRRIGALRICKDNKGQSLVELALVLPLILLLLMGVAEFGRVFHTYLIITQGSREAARLAVVGGGDTAITRRVEEVTNTSLDESKLQIEISPAERERIRGTPVIVTVKYQLDLIIPNVMNILPDPFIITSRTVMRME